MHEPYISYLSLSNNFLNRRLRLDVTGQLYPGPLVTRSDTLFVLRNFMGVTYRR